MIFPTAQERALEEAMLRSSPEPEVPTFRKRTRGDDDEGRNGDDTEPESDTPPTLPPLVPTSSNVTAASLRYATQKRIRSEQRGELDTFLLVSPLPLYFPTCF